jgi:hypothetical protein
MWEPATFWPNPTRRKGSILMTNSRSVLIHGIETRFLDGTGKRDWRVYFGGALPPSAARMIRRLTS